MSTPVPTGQVPSESGNTNANTTGQVPSESGNTNANTTGQVPSESGNTNANTTGQDPPPEASAATENEREVAEKLKQKAATGNKGSGASKPSGISKNNTTETTTIKKRETKARGQRALAAAQQDKVVEEVMACGATDYHEILSLESGAPIEAIREAYWRKATMTNPEQSKNVRAAEAYKRVELAAKELGLGQEESAYEAADVQLLPEDMEGLESTDTREIFFERAFGRGSDAHNVLGKLMLDPQGAEPRRLLNDINTAIGNRNSRDGLTGSDATKGFIDVDAFARIFQSALAPTEALKKDPNDTAARELFDAANKEVKALCGDHEEYPDFWCLNPPSEDPTNQTDKQRPAPKTNKNQPGYTVKGFKIGAYRHYEMGNRYYVEKTVHGMPTWFVETTKDVGGRAGAAYEKYPEKVEFGDSSRKYRKRDLDKFEKVLHVGCKAPYSRREPKDGRKPRRPLTDVLALFDGKNTPMTYSDLVAMLGPADALYEIEQYYDARSLSYPWDEEPEETITVIKRKKDITKPTKEVGDSGDKVSANSGGNAELAMMMAQMTLMFKQVMKSNEETMKSNMEMMNQKAEPKAGIVKVED